MTVSPGGAVMSQPDGELSFALLWLSAPAPEPPVALFVLPVSCWLSADLFDPQPIRNATAMTAGSSCRKEEERSMPERSVVRAPLDREARRVFWKRSVRFPSMARRPTQRLCHGVLVRT